MRYSSFKIGKYFKFLARSYFSIIVKPFVKKISFFIILLGRKKKTIIYEKDIIFNTRLR